MTEVPTTHWTRDFDDRRARRRAAESAKWQRTLGVVTHTFTHFPLALRLHGARSKRHRGAGGNTLGPLSDSPTKRCPMSCARWSSTP